MASFHLGVPHTIQSVPQPRSHNSIYMWDFSATTFPRDHGEKGRLDPLQRFSELRLKSVQVFRLFVG